MLEEKFSLQGLKQLEAFIPLNTSLLLQLLVLSMNRGLLVPDALGCSGGSLWPSWCSVSSRMLIMDGSFYSPWHTHHTADWISFFSAVIKIYKLHIWSLSWLTLTPNIQCINLWLKVGIVENTPGVYSNVLYFNIYAEMCTLLSAHYSIKYSSMNIWSKAL